MADTSQLLKLPGELRDHIWHLAFQGLEVTPSRTKARDLDDCLECFRHPKKHTLYSEAFLPLLACKQIYAEAGPLFRNTLTLRIPELDVFMNAMTQSKHPLCRHSRSITIDLHLDEDNRHIWTSTPVGISKCFPSLQHIEINNHMRPAMSFNSLLDAAFLAGPLVLQPPHLAYPQHMTVHFAYVLEAIMFEQATLGVVRVSEALEEHSAVVKDLLVDPEFKAAAELGDSHRMSSCLVNTARAHEEPWLESLRKRREDPRAVDGNGS